MQPIDLPIERVTLLEDRAYVLRRGRVELKEGLNRLHVAGVTPVVVDKTLTASAKGCGARVVDVRLVRREPERPAAPPPPQSRDGAEAHRRNELALVERELAAAGRLISEALHEVVRAVTRGEACRDDWEGRLAALRQWKEELLERQLELERPAGERKVPARPGAPPSAVEACLVLEVQAAVAGPVQLQAEYCVPGACWRPYHTARLGEDEREIQFRCDGCVWQNTGEAWEDVRLLFSTQRPSLGVDPPELGTDRLEVRKKSPDTVLVERDEQLERLSDEGDGPKAASLAEVPGIDDGGEVVKLRAAGRVTVPSHGQPVRVELFAFGAPTRLERVLMAEAAPAVMLKTVQVNAAPGPILAGPVDLVRGTGWVGRGTVLYVAPGESFALGWGPDPSLRAQRQVSQGEESKDDLLGGWRKVEHTVTLSLSNLGLEPRALVAIERVPVSEVKQVEVVCEAVTPDADGFVRWEAELGPRGRRQIELKYAVRRRKEVVGVS